MVQIWLTGLGRVECHLMDFGGITAGLVEVFIDIFSEHHESSIAVCLVDVFSFCGNSASNNY